MVLGLGAGWQINEHHAYGIELEPPGKGVSRFAEAIQILRSMLSQESTTFHGACYDITEAPCDPKPVHASTPPPGRASISGSAEQLIDELGQCAELGFDEFILPDGNLGRDKSQRADNLARIKAEVLDHLPA